MQWCSSESAHFAAHDLNTIFVSSPTEDFKYSIHSFQLDIQRERDAKEKKSKSLVAVCLGKAFNRIPSFLCDR